MFCCFKISAFDSSDVRVECHSQMQTFDWACIVNDGSNGMLHSNTQYQTEIHQFDGASSYKFFG